MKQQWKDEIRRKMSEYREKAPEFPPEELEAIQASHHGRQIRAVPAWAGYALAAAIVGVVAGIGFRLFRAPGPDGQQQVASVTAQPDTQGAGPADKTLTAGLGPAADGLDSRGKGRGPDSGRQREGTETAVPDGGSPLEGLTPVQGQQMQASDKGLVPEALVEISPADKGETAERQSGIGPAVKGEAVERQNGIEPAEKGEAAERQSVIEPAVKGEPRTDIEPAVDIFRDNWGLEKKAGHSRRLTAQTYMVGAGAASKTLIPGLASARAYGSGDEGINVERAELEMAGATKMDVRHMHPVRVGVSIKYDMGGGWGVESGLTYSHHISDFSTSMGNYAYETTQRLSYIGIPVAFSCRFAGWKYAGLYASAGGMAEKMVYGRQSTYSIEGAKRTFSAGDELSMNPLQFSLNASVGMDYRVARGLSLFAEPGIRYSFDNGSEVRSIYSDRPLDFNLTIGIRFNLE